MESSNSGHLNFQVCSIYDICKVSLDNCLSKFVEQCLGSSHHKTGGYIYIHSIIDRCRKHVFNHTLNTVHVPSCEIWERCVDISVPTNKSRE
jgi:hypothetical protein